MPISWNRASFQFGVRLFGCPAVAVPLLCRCGGAAILLSNKMFDGFRAKYKLLHSIRTQNASEESLNCVIQTEDSTGRCPHVVLCVCTLGVAHVEVGGGVLRASCVCVCGLLSVCVHACVCVTV